MTIDAFDLIGLGGVVVLLAAYGLTVADRIDARRPAALALNFAGASLILVSLWQDFNLSAAVIEGAWAVIALLGLLRHAVRRS